MLKLLHFTLYSKYYTVQNSSTLTSSISKLQLPDGSKIPLPPIILGKLGSDPSKKTVCVYGHLDVQPAALEDGWDSEPFVLIEREGKACLYLTCFYMSNLESKF